MSAVSNEMPLSRDLQSVSGWDRLWQKHVAQYVQGNPRAGRFLHYFFSADRTSLELGAGSCVDSVYLASRGVDATAGDFSPYAIEQAKRNYPGSKCKFELVDAFATPYADKSFDLVFHSGVIGLFDDDQAHAMVCENIRVSRRRVVLFVHNAHNKKLAARFARLRETEDIYRIRFFSKAQLITLLGNCGVTPDRISFRKFGGPADTLAHRWFAWTGLWRMAPFFYQLQPWSGVERIACVVRLDA